MPAGRIFAEVERRLQETARRVAMAQTRDLLEAGIASDSWHLGSLPLPDVPRSTATRPVFTFRFGREGRMLDGAFLGPFFPGPRDPDHPVGGLPENAVGAFLSSVRDVPLARAIEGLSVKGALVPWRQFGSDTRLMCVLDGPQSRPQTLPLEDVLPTGCLIHVIDSGDGQAKKAALRIVDAVSRRRQRFIWMEGLVASSFAVSGRSVTFCETAEQMLQLWDATMRQVALSTGESRAPDVILLWKPAAIPSLEEHMVGAGLLPDPKAAVMWANVLPELLLRRTTVVAFHSCPAAWIAEGHSRITPEMAPWRTNARYEVILRPEG